MKAVFADTAFFLALINPRDQYHRSAVEMNSALDMPLVTTAWALLSLPTPSQPAVPAGGSSVCSHGCVWKLMQKSSHPRPICLIADVSSPSRAGTRNGR